jgi:DNA-binding IclR family transcriptional regulator
MGVSTRLNLGVLQETFIYYIQVIETTKNLRWQVHAGTHDPFYCTALGRARIAHLPIQRQKHLLERTVIKRRTSFTVFTVSGGDQLRAILTRTRYRIWALDDQENDEGVACSI